MSSISPSRRSSYHAGTAVSADLAGLARTRKAEYAAFQELDLPHRIETRGPVYHGNGGQPVAPSVPKPGQHTLRGTGCYPGVVEAPARIILNPTDDLALSGRILVTLRTDPAGHRCFRWPAVSWLSVAARSHSSWRAS